MAERQLCASKQTTVYYTKDTMIKDSDIADSSRHTWYRSLNIEWRRPIKTLESNKPQS